MSIPYQLAQKIFASLPIERIRPEKRFIFISDGEEMLAIAARARLAKLTDIPQGIVPTEYASSHVVRGEMSNQPIIVIHFRDRGDIVKGKEIIENLEEGSQFALIFSACATDSPEFYRLWKSIAIPAEKRLEYAKYHLLEYWYEDNGPTQKDPIYILIGEKKAGDRVLPLLRTIDLNPPLNDEKERKGFIGQVTKVSEDNKQIRLYISRFAEDDDEEGLGEWVATPDNLPGWALDGTPFWAKIDKEVKSYTELRDKSWVLSNFTHESRPYYTTEELMRFWEMPLGVIGIVIRREGDRILLRLSGLLDEEDEQWIDILPELPGWALDGTVFYADLDPDIETFAQLRERPSGLKNFKHTPHPYLTDEELKTKLSRMVNKENQS